jgi:drug/metabolite transporter (DMT)-like permease
MPTTDSHTSSKTRFSVIDLMLIGMSFIWGINFTVVKIALEDLLPLSFNLIRFSLASLFLLALLWIRERNLGIRKKDVGRLFMLGFIGNTAYQLLFIHGISHTTAGNSSLILATTPLFVALLSSFLHIEKIQRRIWYGVTLSFIGIVFISIGAGKSPTIPSENWIGDLLVLIGTICWSTYTVFSKPLLQWYSPLKLTTLTVAMGTPLLVLVSIPSVTQQNWSTVSTQAWLSLAFSFSLAIAIGYVVWYTGVNKIGNARTALYENLVTVTAVVVAWLILAENMTPVQVLGMGLVFFSLYLAQRTSKANANKSK